MKKLTRKVLNDFAKEAHIINENEQRSFIGGGDGTANNPYTKSEFDYMISNGIWQGGYVEGWGYTYPDLSCTSSFSGGTEMSESELRNMLVGDGLGMISAIMQEFINQPGISVVFYGADAARENQINDILNYMEKNGLNSVYKIDAINSTFQGGGTYDYRTTIESKFYSRQTGEYIGSVYYYY